MDYKSASVQRFILRISRDCKSRLTPVDNLIKRKTELVTTDNYYDDNMIRCLALWVLLLFINVSSFGQTKYLMLQKKNKNKNVYYKIGDVISLKVNGRKSKIKGEILQLKDSVIVFRDYEIIVNEITHLYIDEKTKWWLRYKVEQISLIVGGGYLLLELINTGDLNRDVLITSGTLIGVGLLAKLIIGNKIPIKGRTELRILKL